MRAEEYTVTSNNPALLTPEIVKRIFTAVQEEAVMCLSDIKRVTEFKYDVIRAALYFLESENLITVLDEESRRLGLQSHQMPVKITKAGRRTGPEELVSAFLRQGRAEGAVLFIADYKKLSLST
jgi:hypothetical protein